MSYPLLNTKEFGTFTHESWLEQQAASLAGKEVNFWGCGATYQKYRHVFAKAHPRYILVDFPDAPQSVNGISVKHPAELQASSPCERLPIVVFTRVEHFATILSKLVWVYDFIVEGEPIWCIDSDYLSSKRIEHPGLDRLLRKPSLPLIVYSRDYAGMPNYVRSMPVTQSLPKIPIQASITQELGVAPEQRTFPPSYSELPDLYIHEFSNILLINGYPFDDHGNLIFDALRVFGADRPVLYDAPVIISGIGALCSQKTDSIPSLAGEYIYATPSSYFGHQLLETLTQSWCFNTFPNARMIFALRHEPEKYFMDFIKAYNLEKKNFISPADICIVEKLYVPTRAYMHGHYITETAVEIWKGIRDFYASIVPSSPKKIYLSRRYFDKRKLVNEIEVEKIFSDYGFSIVQMEALSAKEQICMIYNATHIAGPIGSAMHNLVFSNDTYVTDTLLLLPRGILEEAAYRNIECAYGRTFNAVYGESLMPVGVTPRFYNKFPWRIDINNLESALSQWLNIEVAIKHKAHSQNS